MPAWIIFSGGAAAGAWLFDKLAPDTDEGFLDRALGSTGFLIALAALGFAAAKIMRVR